MQFSIFVSYLRIAMREHPTIEFCLGMEGIRVSMHKDGMQAAEVLTYEEIAQSQLNEIAKTASRVEKMHKERSIDG